jgi:hypothetical protein
MKFCFLLLVALFACAGMEVPALAKDGIQKSTKTLSKVEIIAELGGKTVNWSNAIQGGVIQYGSETFSNDMLSSRGVGKQGKQFKWSFVSRANFKGNTYCYASKASDAKIFTPSPPICVKILRRGNQYYMVKPSGRAIIVLSVLRG